MQKIIRYFKHTFICILLSFSLVCTNTAATTYQAAAIPVVYSSWEILVAIFALLGISICAAPELEDEAAEEIIDKFVGWRVLNGGGLGDNNGDGEDDFFSEFNIMDFLFGNHLTMSEEDVELWQSFVQEQGWTIQHEPISDIDISTLSYEEFCDVYLSLLGIDEFASDSYVKKFLSYSYEKLVATNFTGIVKSYSNNSHYYYQLVPLNPISEYGFYESVNGSSAYIFGTTSYASKFSFSEIRFTSGVPASVTYNLDNTFIIYDSDITPVHCFFVGGRLYNFYEFAFFNSFNNLRFSSNSNILTPIL